MGDQWCLGRDVTKVIGGEDPGWGGIYLLEPYANSQPLSLDLILRGERSEYVITGKAELYRKEKFVGHEDINDRIRRMEGFLLSYGFGGGSRSEKAERSGRFVITWLAIITCWGLDRIMREFHINVTYTQLIDWPPFFLFL